MLKRGLLLAVLVAVAVGGLALAASGREHAAAKPAAAVAAGAEKKQAAELPPLPDMRPKVVEPVAGNGGDETAPPVTDPGLTEVGPKPKGPASAGATKRGSGVTADPSKARALGNGVAVPPLEAPEEVKQIIEAGNIIARTPYLWGGGHGKWLDKGYDCSGSVSFALAAAGLLHRPPRSRPPPPLGGGGAGEGGGAFAE